MIIHSSLIYILSYPIIWLLLVDVINKTDIDKSYNKNPNIKSLRKLFLIHIYPKYQKKK